MGHRFFLAAVTAFVIAAFTQPAQAMYHPTVGRFLQRDSSGYADGMSLYEYVNSRPPSLLDTGGLWIVKREGKQYAAALAEPGDTIASLADIIGLNALEWQAWLGWKGLEGFGEGKYRVDDNKVRRLGSWLPLAPDVLPIKSEQDKLSGCEWFQIPNTVLAYWAGELGGSGKWWVMWRSDVQTLHQRGFKVAENQGWTGARFNKHIADSTADKTLHGIFFWGHGVYSDVLKHEWWDIPSLFDKYKWIGVLTDSSKKGQTVYVSLYASWAPRYELGLGVLWACGTNAARIKFSANATFRGSQEVLWPHGFHLYGDKMQKIIKPGDQGTRK
jgi:hypothetical protein